MSEQHDLIVRVKAEVNQALRELDRLDDEVQDNERSFGGMGQAAAVAGGMIATQLLDALKETVIESVQLAAAIGPLKNGFAAMTEGVDPATLSLESLREAVGGTVSDMGLLTAANNALALGLPTEDLNDLFAAARKVGNAMGRTTLEAVNDLTTGLGRQSKLILDNLGIVVNTEQAYRDYADSIGKSVSQLDDSERTLAFQSAAMDELNEKAAALGDTQNELTDTLAVWDASVENTKVKLGEFAGSIIVANTLLARELTGAFNSAGDAIQAYESDYEEFRDNLGRMDDDVARDANEMVTRVSNDLQTLSMDYGELSRAAAIALDNIGTDMDAFDTDLQNTVTLMEGVADRLALFRASLVGETGAERVVAGQEERGAISTLAARSIRDIPTGQGLTVTVNIDRAELNPENVEEVTEEIFDKLQDRLQQGE